MSIVVLGPEVQGLIIEQKISFYGVLNEHYYKS